MVLTSRLDQVVVGELETYEGQVQRDYEDEKGNQFAKHCLNVVFFQGGQPPQAVMRFVDVQSRYESL